MEKFTQIPSVYRQNYPKSLLLSDNFTTGLPLSPYFCNFLLHRPLYQFLSNNVAVTTLVEFAVAAYVNRITRLVRVVHPVPLGSERLVLLHHAVEVRGIHADCLVTRLHLNLCQGVPVPYVCIWISEQIRPRHVKHVVTIVFLIQFTKSYNLCHNSKYVNVVGNVPQTTYLILFVTKLFKILIKYLGCQRNWFNQTKNVIFPSGSWKSLALICLSKLRINIDTKLKIPIF